MFKTHRIWSFCLSWILSSLLRWTELSQKRGKKLSPQENSSRRLDRPHAVPLLGGGTVGRCTERRLLKETKGNCSHSFCPVISSCCWDRSEDGYSECIHRRESPGMTPACAVWCLPFFFFSKQKMLALNSSADHLLTGREKSLLMTYTYLRAISEGVLVWLWSMGVGRRKRTVSLHGNSLPVCRIKLF